jgi:hypothetical protein
MNTHKIRILILVAVSIAALIVLFFAGRIPQDPAYHLFVDKRAIGILSNAWNVLSNIPFLLVGLYGFSRYGNLSAYESKKGYLTLCMGVLLVGFGSAWYHYVPSTSSLLWDRLPMTIVFMSLFSLLLDERVLVKSKWSTLLPLLMAGIFSAIYWAWTESMGSGDLRPYILVQFLPLILVPLIIALFKSEYISNKLLILSFGFYAIAKLLENFDLEVFNFTQVVSGHSLKHLVAAAAVLCIVSAIPTQSNAAN